MFVLNHISGLTRSAPGLITFGFAYLHPIVHWRAGSLAFWDNRSTWHFAVNDYQGERRLLHRITIEGVPLN